MKYAITSDIHGNIEALDAVLQDQKKQACTHLACLADIVGLGPDPRECADYIRALDIPVVKGNWEDYAGTDMDLETSIVELHRVDYDIQTTMRKLRELGFGDRS